MGEDGTPEVIVRRVDALERRVAAMADALARLPTEVRTRQLVVVDEHGAPRVVAAVTRGTAELAVRHDTDDGVLEVVLHAGAPDLDDTSPAVGIQVRVAGNALTELDAAPNRDGRWRATLSVDSLDLSEGPAPRRPPRTAQPRSPAAPGPIGS